VLGCLGRRENAVQSAHLLRPEPLGDRVPVRASTTKSITPVLRLLQLFPQVLSFPTRNPSILLEPREVDGATATRWDVGSEMPREVAEVKLNPTKDDVDEWMHRCLSHSGRDAVWV
jgi:hypothetical protein